MNHKQLVQEAKKWLINAQQCNPVFCEKGSSGCSELPDAIGWDTEHCIIVECKTSRADLLANNKKNLSLGDFRYFIMTNDLYEEVKDIIPEGWGTIIAGEGRYPRLNGRHFTVKKVESNKISEIRYLRSRILEIQRYGK